MNTLSNLKMPRAVCCGEDALKKMPEILQAASVKKAAVFTDKGIRSAGLLDPVLEQLQKSQAAFCVPVSYTHLFRRRRTETPVRVLPPPAGCFDDIGR